MKKKNLPAKSLVTKAEKVSQLAQLSPNERARLLGENFDQVQVLTNKREYRRKLARLPIPDKMGIQQGMMKNSQVRRGARRSAATQTKPLSFGGRSTVSGVNYEERIAAFYGVKMLAGGGASLWGDVPVADLSAITMQTADPVDDIVLSRKGANAKMYVSAKSRSQRVPLTPTSAFGAVIGSFTRQFLELSSAHRQTCWIIWAVTPLAGEPATRDLRRVLDHLRDSDPDEQVEDFLRNRTPKERTAFERLQEVAIASWKKAAGVIPAEPDLRAFLRRVRVQVYNFEPSGGELPEAESILADSVVLDPQQAALAWRTVVGCFDKPNEHGTAVTLTLLRAALAKAGIALKSSPGYVDEIKRLQELTERNFLGLAAHDALQTGTDPAEVVHMDRTPELNALKSAATSGHLLVTGEPGSGKSGLMHSLVHAFKESGTPVVLLLAEQMSGRDWKGNSNLPGFDRHPLDEILAHWPAGVPGVLLTDALDAVRDPDVQRNLRDLLGDVQRGCSGWKVVASVREFDLDHGQELRKMFRGVGVPGFASPRFNNVAHFHVPHLSDGQLDDLIRHREQFRPFIERAKDSPKSENLHRSPFYLQLAAELMRDGFSPERVADWASPAVLLRKYWEARVEKEPHAVEIKPALYTICEGMVKAHNTVVAEQDIKLQAGDHIGIKELRGRGVLRIPFRSGGTRVGGETLAFTHHLLHDYAVGTSLIPKQPPERLVGFVASQPLFPVFYRQSFVFALEELWDGGEDGNRGQFWSTALRLEGSSALHGITRIVAPVLAARRVENFEDLQPLLEALAKDPGYETAANRALRHLISGLQDTHSNTVRAGAAGWLRFAVELSEMLASDAAVEWPLVLLLDLLNKLDEKQPLSPRGSLNDVGRSLLSACLGVDASVRRVHSMNVAITAICQSFDAAPTDSRAALLALLTPERLRERSPHRALSQLADGLHHLGPNGDEIVRRLFETVFTREQEPGDWEERGTMLSSMLLQTSDLWNSIRHTLASYYKKRDGTNADLLTELACIVLNKIPHCSDDATDSKLTVLAAIPFCSMTCELVEDFASFHGHGFDLNHDAIFSRFRELLQGWAAANDQPRLDAMLNRFARDCRNSSMWSLVLQAGAEYPDSFGVLLESVLTEPAVLIHADYIYAGVELFGALHRAGKRNQRLRLERLILTLHERFRPWREVDDAQVERWITETRRRLLGTLHEANLILKAIRVMKAAAPTVPNEPFGGFDFESHPVSDAELMERLGIDMAEPANGEMFRLREELKRFLRQNNQQPKSDDIERFWPVIVEAEQVHANADGAHPQMARQLWGYLVSVCASIAAVMEWPATDPRWQLVRRVLLQASTDAFPTADDDGDDEKDGPLSWSWPAPRIDAAEGLPWLLHRLGMADKSLADALRTLCGDGSTALRHNLARRLSLLHDTAPALMWELLETVAAHDRRFSVLAAVVESLRRLWTRDEERVLAVLATVARRAEASAPPEHEIHTALAGTHLFHFLETGSAASERYISRLIATCDHPRAHALWRPQLHHVRENRWLTLGGEPRSSPEADAARGRVWRFFLDLLTAARAKLEDARQAIQSLAPDASLESDPVRLLVETRDRLGHLVHDIGMQIYFASGAFAERQPGQDEKLSPVKLRRFWRDAGPCLAALADEKHPSVAHQLVQTLAHLLPCAPEEIFLLAARSIQASADGGGYQYEPQAVHEVVKLVQRILADHSELLVADEGESTVFKALLGVLDVFVEAGWAEARRLTHRLEEIYR